MSDNFDLNTGGGNPSFSFGPQGSQPGAGISGTVIALAEVQQVNFDTKKPETWDNGDPKMQLRLTLQTDLRDPNIQADTGVRDVYLRGRKKPHDNGAKSTICAALDAVRAATGGTSMQRGGRFMIQWVSGMGFAGDPRNYQAQYAPPAMDLGGPQDQAQQPPVQQQPQGWVQPSQPQNWPAQQPQGEPWAVPAQQAVPTQQQVAQPPAWVQTEQGPVSPQTGVIAQQPAPAPVPGAPSPEQLAALNAAGINDPAKIREIYPAYAG